MEGNVLIHLIHLTHRVCGKIEGVFLRLVKKFFRRKTGGPGAASAYRTISHLLRDDQISEPMTRRFSRLGVRFPASFASALVNRSAKKDYRTLPEWCINNKITGRDFARRMSVQIPDTLQESVPCSDIEIASDTVIKPASGSSAHGVYLVFDEHDMYEVASKQRLASYGSALCKEVLRQVHRMTCFLFCVSHI